VPLLRGSCRGSGESNANRINTSDTARLEMSFAEKNSTQKSGLSFPSKAGNRHQLEPFRLQLMTDILSAGHGAAMQDDLADVTFTDLPSDNARKSASAAYGIIMKTLTTTQRDTSWLAALEGA